jgi:hypothetical protein
MHTAKTFVFVLALASIFHAEDIIPGAKGNHYWDSLTWR